MKKGIDVSEHQGLIEWVTVKQHIDFVFIRAGWGTTVDRYFVRNIAECNRLQIPVGVYWFSYAKNNIEAIAEAEQCIKTVAPYTVNLGIAFDFEDDSDRIYNAVNGRYCTGTYLSSLANEFLAKIKSAGYKPIIYSNLKYLNRGLKNLLDKYQLWYANWTDKLPSNSPNWLCWQYSSAGVIPGIKTAVDLNVMKIEEDEKTTENVNYKKYVNTCIEKLPDSWYESYYNTALAVVAGKFGNGEQRKIALAACGFDYSIVQSIVNKLCGV